MHLLRTEYPINRSEPPAWARWELAQRRPRPGRLSRPCYRRRRGGINDRIDCRPYRKNDQAHVEQKNWSVVRKLVGYDCYESEAAVAQLNRVYALPTPSTTH